MNLIFHSSLGNSKLANILFTRELAQRLVAKTPSGKDISTYTLHPGTGLSRIIPYLAVMTVIIVGFYVFTVLAFILTVIAIRIYITKYCGINMYSN